MTLPEMETQLAALLEPQLIATNEGTHGEPDSWRRYLCPDCTTYYTGSGRPKDNIGREQTFSHEPSRVRLPKIEQLRKDIEAARKNVAVLVESVEIRYRGNGMLAHPYGGPQYSVEEDLQCISRIDPTAAESLREKMNS